MSKKKESSKVPTKETPTTSTPTATSQTPTPKKPTPKKSLTLTTTKTDSAKRRSLEKTEGPEARKKIILAPFPVLDLVRHTPKTGKCCRIFSQIFCCIISVIVMVCALPIFESVLFPEYFYSRFDSLIWDPLLKTEIEPQQNGPSLLINVNLRYDNIVFNLKLYSKFDSMTKLNEIDKIFVCVDNGKIDDSIIDHFVLCSPFPDHKPTYQKYVQVMKLCYLYVRQIVWNARIIGLGHRLGGNILIRASNELWKDYCYSFNGIVMIQTKSEVLEEVKDALFYFQFADIIEKNLMREMRIENMEILRDALKLTKVTVYHVTDNDNEKHTFETILGNSYHHSKTLQNALNSIPDGIAKDKHKPRKSVFERYDEEKKCLMEKKTFSFF